MPNLFNVGAFFVLFREALEAAIVLGVLLQYLERTVTQDNKLLKQLKKQVWIGTILGVVLSIFIGAAFTVIFYVLKQNVFEEAEPIYEGVLMSLAALFLTYLAFKMLNISALQTKWKSRIDAATQESTSYNSKRSKFGFMMLAFTVIVREGIECIVFMTGVGQGEPESLILPGLLGLAAGILIGYLVYRGAGQIQLGAFFLVSSALLLMIAAGLASNAAHEFEEYFGESPVLWDISYCCSEKTNGFFQVMKVLVGWRAEATVITTVTYFSYWVFVILLALSLKLYKTRQSKQLDRGSSATTLVEKVPQKTLDEPHVHI